MTPDERIAAMTFGVLLDAWLTGSSIFWSRRAAQLESARPRRGDYTGLATPEDVVQQWDRLTEAADACRARAVLTDLSRTEFDETLADLAGGAAA